MDKTDPPTQPDPVKVKREEDMTDEEYLAHLEAEFGPRELKRLDPPIDWSEATIICALPSGLK